MTATQEDLRQLVQSRLDELGITAREAARRSNSAISYETLYAVTTGRRRSELSARGAEGIAAALSIPVSRVWAAVGKTAPEPWDMGRFEPLSPTSRQVVESVAARLLALEKAGER
jgi:hypothetical protein